MTMALSGRKILTAIILVTVGLLMAYPLGYWWAGRSEPYSLGCSFAAHDAEIMKQIGPVRTCNMSSWFAYNIQYHGPNGSAQFQLRIIGEKGAGDLFVSMATIDGQWTVQSAKLKRDDRFITVR
jgi:hypothetical protein